MGCCVSDSARDGGRNQEGNPGMSAHEYWGIGHWSPMKVKRRRKQGSWRPGIKQTFIRLECTAHDVSPKIKVYVNHSGVAGLFGHLLEYIDVLKRNLCILKGEGVCLKI